MKLLTSLRSRLDAWLSDHGRARKKDLTYHEKLADLLSRCPCCDGGLADHELAMAASVSLKEGGELDRLRTLVENRDWVSLADLDDWQGVTDNVVLYALRCPSGGIALFELFSPLELFGSPRVLAVQVLSSEESRCFQAEAEWEWTTLQEAIAKGYTMTAT